MKSAFHLSYLINDILEYSKILKNVFNIEKSWVDPLDLIH